MPHFGRPSTLLALLFAGNVIAARLSAAQGDRAPVERIRFLVAQGDSSGARRIADSLVTDTGSAAAAQADGYFWRGTLAPTARERRLDFARVVVDYPFTAVAGDALFRLAQMDLDSGDRANAQRQLQRAFRDYGASSTGGDAAFELGQLLLARGETRDGCAALDSAIQRTPVEQVEKRNRMTYVRRPCAQLASVSRDSQPEPGAPGGARNEGAPPRGGGTPSRNRPSASARLWSAQVGAFASKGDADRIAERLTARGYEARVTGERPFRVRIGRFSSRAEAAALVAKLKAERTSAILVEAERP